MEPMDANDSTPVAVAAFDVDHTLTVKDCVVPFLREVLPSRDEIVTP
mgnify:CR=1 FL=1